MLQKEKQGKKNKIGALGEDIAAKYLQERHFTPLDQNFWQKWGEIDLIMKKNEVIHFVEVKTVSYETKESLLQAVSHETWRPEEQVHQAKLQKLRRTAETWLLAHNWVGEAQLDVVAVRVVPEETYASVNYIPQISGF